MYDIIVAFDSTVTQSVCYNFALCMHETYVDAKSATVDSYFGLTGPRQCNAVQCST